MTMQNLEPRTDLNWLGVIKKITHFFITQLALLRGKNQDLQKILPSLFKAYQIALEHKLVEADIEERLITFYQNPQKSDMSSQIEPMFQVLNSISSLCGQVCTQKTTPTTTSVAECITHALLTYPFEKNQREMIDFKPENDFEIQFSPRFIEETLIALLNFALNNIQDNTGSNITIYFTNKDNAYSIHFKINSSDVTKYPHKYLLENYLNIDPDKTLPGIPFCQLALTYVNGNISCEIRNGDYLDLIITIHQLS